MNRNVKSLLDICGDAEDRSYKYLMNSGGHVHIVMRASHDSVAIAPINFCRMNLFSTGLMQASGIEL